MTRHSIKIQKQKLDAQTIHNRKNFNTVMHRYKRTTRMHRLSNLIVISGTLVIILVTVNFLLNLSLKQRFKSPAETILIDSLPVIPHVEMADLLPPVPVAQVNNPRVPARPPVVVKKKAYKKKDYVDNTPEMNIYQQDNEAEIAQTAEIFQVVEQHPEPVGGMEVFNAYIRKNLKYPNEVRKKEIQGKVYIGFVVNTDSSLTDIILLRGIGKECDEEAVRVIRESPVKWIPGKQGGKPVRVRMAIPIEFRYDGNTTASDKQRSLIPFKPS